MVCWNCPQRRGSRQGKPSVPFWLWRLSQFRHAWITTLQTQVSHVSIGHRICPLSAELARRLGPLSAGFPPQEVPLLNAGRSILLPQFKQGPSGQHLPIVKRRTPPLQTQRASFLALRFPVRPRDFLKGRLVATYGEAHQQASSLLSSAFLTSSVCLHFSGLPLAGLHHVLVITTRRWATMPPLPSRPSAGIFASLLTGKTGREFPSSDRACSSHP